MVWKSVRDGKRELAREAREQRQKADEASTTKVVIRRMPVWCESRAGGAAWMDGFSRWAFTVHRRWNKENAQSHWGRLCEVHRYGASAKAAKLIQSTGCTARAGFSNTAAERWWD